MIITSLPNAVKEETRLTEPCQTFKGHTHWVMGTIHLPGGERIITSSRDGSLGVWSLQTGRQIANWQGGGNDIHAITLSVDGKIVSGSHDGVVRLWSIETGKVIAEWTGHTLFINSVCWNREGKRVLSGSSDGTARVWDVETGKTVLEINNGLAWVYAAVFSPDSSIIATGGDSWEAKFIKIWDADTGKLISILKGHTQAVGCLVWTIDGSTLISGSWDGSIRTWDTSTWQQIAVFTGHTHYVWGIAISPNGRILASASLDNTARLWNIENGQPIGSPLQHHNRVNCLSFSTDGNLLATGCGDNNAYIWDISAFVKENDELSFLYADATRRRPVQQAKNLSTVPASFFAELFHSPDSATKYPVSPPSVAHNSGPPHHPDPAIASCTSPDFVLPCAQPDVQPSSPEPNQSRLLKWLRSKTPAPPIVLQRARLPLLKWRKREDDEALELRGHSPITVDVPLGVGNLRYASKAEVEARKRERKKRKEKEKEKREEEERCEGEVAARQNRKPGDESYKQPSVHPGPPPSRTVPSHKILRTTSRCVCFVYCT